MSKVFQAAHEFVAKWEGGLSDHPNDRGGVTAYGASLEFVKDIAKNASGQQFLTSLGVRLPVTRKTILALTKAQVMALFRREFWDLPKIGQLPDPLAFALYDCAVNMGAKTAIRLGQQACCQAGLNIAVDGIIGPKTIAAMQKKPLVILDYQLALRSLRYNAIANANKSQQVFLKGWLNRLNDLTRTLQKAYPKADWS